MSFRPLSRALTAVPSAERYAAGSFRIAATRRVCDSGPVRRGDRPGRHRRQFRSVLGRTRQEPAAEPAERPAQAGGTVRTRDLRVPRAAARRGVSIQRVCRPRERRLEGWRGTAIARDNAQGRFYREVLGHFGKIGRSVAFRLAAGGKTLAVDFGLRDGDVITLLKTTYDEKMKSFSPAQLLHEDLFKAIFDRGDVARVEFFGKVMEWHTRWTDNERVLYHLTAYRWPIIRRAKEAIT